MSEQNYDAILIVGFGGPEGPDDVMPFLENVLRGKNVPHERMLEVAEHYYKFDGVSPINAQVRSLMVALIDQLNAKGPHLPVYWGNRNWHPMLTDTIQQMAEDGIQRALAWFTSPYSSYSSCRQYRENLQHSCEEVGSEAPQIDKLRGYFNHPLFLEAQVDCVQQSLEQIDTERRSQSKLLFTAHSIPNAMAEKCSYETQLLEVSEHVAKAVGVEDWKLVYQSRSGPPQQPWLEPDVCDHLRDECLAEKTGGQAVVIAPIGFISDHIEVLYDLDTEARLVCEELGISMIRARTLENDPKFIEMIRQLIEERVSGDERVVCGESGALPDVCPDDCCLSGRPTRPH